MPTVVQATSATLPKECQRNSHETKGVFFHHEASGICSNMKITRKYAQFREATKKNYKNFKKQFYEKKKKYVYNKKKLYITINNRVQTKLIYFIPFK